MLRCCSESCPRRIYYTSAGTFFTRLA